MPVPLSLTAHGVARIEREVQQRCCKLAGVDDGEPCVVLQPGLDLDLLADCGQQFRCLDDQRVDVGRLRTQRLLVSEREQMPCQRGASFGRLVDQLGYHHKLWIMGNRSGQHFDGADDDGKHVVEVVGHAAGELADRVHFLRLPKLTFGLARLGNIVIDEHGAPDRSRLADQGPSADDNVNTVLRVGTAHDDLHAVELLSEQRPPDRPLIRRQQGFAVRQE
jgi:hypothetical protein